MAVATPRVDTGVSAASLQAKLTELVQAGYQWTNIVYDSGTSSYTVVSQKVPMT